MFNFSTIFALCTTSLYMARSVQIIKIFSDQARAEFFNFSYYLFFQKAKFKNLATFQICLYFRLNNCLAMRYIRCCASYFLRSFYFDSFSANFIAIDVPIIKLLFEFPVPFINISSLLCKSLPSNLHIIFFTGV